MWNLYCILLKLGRGLIFFTNFERTMWVINYSLNIDLWFHHGGKKLKMSAFAVELYLNEPDCGHSLHFHLHCQGIAAGLWQKLLNPCRIHSTSLHLLVPNPVPFSISCIDQCLYMCFQSLLTFLCTSDPLFMCLPGFSAVCVYGVVCQYLVLFQSWYFGWYTQFFCHMMIPQMYLSNTNYKDM